jgi:membrane-associated phospholipid phosphatase
MTPFPTVPADVRRPLAVLVGVAALVFTVLAIRYAGTSEAGHVDRRVDAVVDPVAGGHGRVLQQLVRLGSPPSVVVLAVGLAALCLALGRRRLAVLAIAGPGVTGVCTTLLKPALGRTIGAGGFAFPSGHTGGATALGLVVGLLLASLLRRDRGATLAIIAACALALGGGVGAAMIATNAHYPTDTIGGFCTAVVAVLGMGLVLDRVRVQGGPAPA